MTRSDALAQRLALAVPALLLAGAYIGQYGFDLYPCQLCWWQRYPHFAAVVLALLSFALPPKRLLTACAAGGILTSGLIGAFHAGVEYHWWKGLDTCSAPAIDGANALDAILNAPTVPCDQAAWTLAGVSLAGFNAIISITAALAIYWLLLKKEKA